MLETDVAIMVDGGEIDTTILELIDEGSVVISAHTGPGVESSLMIEFTN